MKMGGKPTQLSSSFYPLWSRLAKMGVGKQKGFTLVEVMISMLIAGILVGAMYSTYTVQRRTQAVQESTSEMQQNIRAALMVLSSDLVMAGYDPQGVGGFGFEAVATFSNGATPSLTEDVTTSSTSLAFTADLDRDGTLDRAAEDINEDGNKDLSEMEQIAYRLNDNTLQRYSTRNGVIEWQIVAENIEALSFNFLDQDGNKLASIDSITEDDIRTVQVALLARSRGITQ
ncbi:MAG: prepilin-type N-terminal cleavage/methylation domain-containing protein, partial [Candidatus Electrothrix sp. ATG2]|nr:prepilin-type N-terminal cleavage/methylation domain-containing protein [Candidatus Electrothrix sp. ATG2]